MKTTQEEIIEKIEELKNAMLEMQEASQAEENIKLFKIKAQKRLLLAREALQEINY